MDLDSGARAVPARRESYRRMASKSAKEAGPQSRVRGVSSEQRRYKLPGGFAGCRASEGGIVPGGSRDGVRQMPA